MAPQAAPSDAASSDCAATNHESSSAGDSDDDDDLDEEVEETEETDESGADAAAADDGDAVAPTKRRRSAPLQPRLAPLSLATLQQPAEVDRLIGVRAAELPHVGLVAFEPAARFYRDAIIDAPWRGLAFERLASLATRFPLDGVELSASEVDDVAARGATLKHFTILYWHLRAVVAPVDADAIGALEGARRCSRKLARDARRQRQHAAKTRDGKRRERAIADHLARGEPIPTELLSVTDACERWASAFAPALVQLLGAGESGGPPEPNESAAVASLEHVQAQSAILVAALARDGTSGADTASAFALRFAVVLVAATGVADAREALPSAIAFLASAVLPRCASSVLDDATRSRVRVLRSSLLAARDACDAAFTEGELEYIVPERAATFITADDVELLGLPRTPAEVFALASDAARRAADAAGSRPIAARRPTPVTKVTPAEYREMALRVRTPPHRHDDGFLDRAYCSADQLASLRLQRLASAVKEALAA